MTYWVMAQKFLVEKLIFNSCVNIIFQIPNLMLMLQTKIKSEIKAHVEKKHKIPNQAILIDHLKISRNDENEVTLSEHWHDSL